MKSFAPFGTISKAYLSPDFTFASLYYQTERQIDAAIAGYKHYNGPWIVQKGYKHIKEVDSDSFSESDSVKQSSFNMDEDLEECHDFVDVNCRKLVVLKSSTGDIFIPYREIRQSGFAIFRKDSYDPIIADKKQILHEFNQHLLAEAKMFLIKNKAPLEEEDIIKTIKRCENILLNPTENGSPVPPPQRQVHTERNKITITAQVATPPTPKVPKHPPVTYPTSKPQTAIKQHETNGSASNGYPIRKPRNETLMKPNIPSIEHIELTKLPAGESHVAVSSIEKEFIYFVHLIDQLSTLEDLQTVSKDVGGLPVVANPMAGNYYLAEFDGDWYRAKLLSVAKLVVFFIDYGNTTSVKSLKPIPKRFESIPAMAIRVTFEKECNVNLKEDTQCRILNIKEFPSNNTYLVRLVKNLDTPSPVPAAAAASVSQPPTSPKEPVQKTYFDVPKTVASLVNSEQVVIIDYVDDKFYVQTKECFNKLREIVKYIKTLDKTDLILKSVKVGQLVLCSRDGLEGLHRANVVQENANVVDVKYVDYPGVDKISTKSLRNVDQYLSAQPSTIIESPKFPIQESTVVHDYIQTLIEKRERLTVILENNAFDLLQTDKRLSEILKGLAAPIAAVTPPQAAPTSPQAAPTPPQAAPTPSQAAPTTPQAAASSPAPSPSRVMFNDMPFITPKIGLDDYMCYSFKDLGQITLISTSDESSQHVDTISVIEVNASEQPYEPELFEMCLALYKDEGEDEAAWYRGVATDKTDGVFEILFVDYGNIEGLRSDALRKYPQNLAATPILGINASFTGLPTSGEKATKIYEYLKPKIPDGEILAIHVKVYEESDLKCLIEIPSIYADLRRLNLF